MRDGEKLQARAEAGQTLGLLRLFSGLTPEMFLSLRAGYGRGDFGHDLIAGLTVAILALPLSLAIAIGSGAEPAKGLISTIVGGALISVLGGTRFQIGGPAAAFIVIISGIVSKHGFDGLLIATLMAGVLDDLAADCAKNGCRIVIAGLQRQPRTALHRAGFLRTNQVILAKTVGAGMDRARGLAAAAQDQA